MKKQGNKLGAAALRQKAEDLLKKETPGSVLPFPEIESIKLLHELQVHQIELELQNEELLQAKEQADLATQKYIELYDFAPMGYFTLSRGGKIIGLNFNAAQMLGTDRSHLPNSMFDFYVSEASRPVFNLFLEKAFKSKNKETCEITLSRKGSLPMYVHLSVIVFA